MGPRSMRRMRLTRGFTVIEALVSIAVLGIFMMGVVATQSYFGTQNVDRGLRTCLLDNASNALLQHRNGITPTTSFTCRNQTGTIVIDDSSRVGIDNTLGPSAENPNDCLLVIATASAGGRSVQVKSSTCDF